MEISETTIVEATLYVLGFFSVLTWSVILLKVGEIALNRFRNARFIKRFWDEGHHPKDDDSIERTQAGRIYQAGAQTQGKATLQLAIHAGRMESWHELIERTLRQQIAKEKSRMDSGLGWLATIGSTSPFVGLFGTVWGIMHALKDISAKGNASLEVVAGPIGEALIATAFGIAVAIPAVIAYNFFLRQNRRLIAHLEHFANDFLHTAIEDHLTQHTLNEHGHSTTN